ncbi:OmpA family protein [candidate division WOR-3 bacterium]|nr:OmpA family protein [candidate division WOR-3 bacterium]
MKQGAFFRGGVFSLICLGLISTARLQARANRFAQNGALNIFYASIIKEGLLSANFIHAGFGASGGICGHSISGVGFAPVSFLELSFSLYAEGYRRSEYDYILGPVRIAPVIKGGKDLTLVESDFFVAPGAALVGRFGASEAWSGDSVSESDPPDYLDVIGIVGLGNDLLRFDLNLGYGFDLENLTNGAVPYGFVFQYSPTQTLDIVLEVDNRVHLDDMSSFDALQITPLVRYSMTRMKGWTFDFALPLGIGEVVPLWKVELGVSAGFDLFAPPKAKMARLVGRVIDESTAQPLAAIIKFPEHEVEPICSDSGSGNYEIKLYPGVYRVRAESKGYKWKEKGVILQEADEKVLDFALAREKLVQAHVAGSVKDAGSGNPLSDVDVNMTGTEISTVVRTDALGVFKASIPPGDYTVSVAKQGYIVRELEISLVNGSFKELDIVLDTVVSVSEAIVKDSTEFIPTKEPVDSFLSIEPVENTMSIEIIEPVDVTDTAEVAITAVTEEETPDTMTKEPEIIEETSSEEPATYDAKFNNVLFNPGSAIISTQSFTALEQVLNFLKFNPSVYMEIQGHTDSIGDDEVNMKLSESRAEAVKKWLVDMGIDPSHLVAKGYGETRPIGDNRTRRGQNANRRIEFVILAK